MSISDVGSFPLIQASQYSPKERTGIDFIVIHTMEADQTPGKARQVAEWFASSGSPDASAHLLIDPYEVVRGVHDKDWAWHAGAANGPSIGIEHAGWAYKTDWNTPESQEELARSAKVVAQYCRAYNIPAVWLTADDLRAGKRGITGHRECNVAFEGGRGHVDPGPNFPRQEYARKVKLYLTLGTAVRVGAGLAVAGAIGAAVYFALGKSK